MSFTLYLLLSFFGLFISSHQSSSLFLFVSNQNDFSFLSSDAAAPSPPHYTHPMAFSQFGASLLLQMLMMLVCAVMGGSSYELTMFDKL